MPDMGNIRIKDENMNKTTIITNVQTRLFELQDLKYRDFHAKLMPTVNKEKIIGVRTPALRVFAKKYGKTDEAKEYLTKLGYVVRIHEVMGVALEDKKGNLNQMLAILAKGELNINYIYSFIIRDGKEPVMVFNTDDFAKAEKVLKEAEVKIVEEADL